MDILQIIKRRRSVRAYKSDSVPEEILNKILEAGRFAPSAHNAQDWKFIVVRDPQKKKDLAKAAFGQYFIEEAPMVIVAVSLNPTSVMSSGTPSYAVDLAIAIDHMILCATENDLGTCWVGGFEQEKVKEILEIPPKFKPVFVIPLGFPNDSAKEKSRKPLTEIISYDIFK